MVRAATGQVGCGTAGAVQINQFNVTSRRDDPPGCVTVTRSRDSAVGLMHSHRGIILKHVATRDWSSSLPLSLVCADTFVGEIKLGINTELFCFLLTVSVENCKIDITLYDNNISSITV